MVDDLQTFLAKRDIELTLTNDQGEAVYAGTAVTVKPQKSNTYLRFAVSPVEHIFPYTKAILHGGRRILSVITISPIRLQDEHSIELVY